MWGKKADRAASEESAGLHTPVDDLRAARPASSTPRPLPPEPGAAQTPEVIVARIRRHGRHLTLPVIVLIAVAGASGFFIGTLPETWMNLVAAAGAALIAILFGIAPILAWLSRRVVITTRRAIVHHGFFVRHRSEVSLARVREVRSKQNPMQRLFASGDIDLYVGAESTRIPDAPGVKDLQAAIQELSEKSYDEHIRWAGLGF